ncbi:MAG TPA: MMPL family transporter, partial [Nitrospiria bacterium]
VHFLSNYRVARREMGMTPPEAVRFAFHTVGSAMWITTAALAGGFLVLLFSGYRMNSDMGLLTAITITMALALDFLYLPSLLLSLDKEQETESKPAGARLRLSP